MMIGEAGAALDTIQETKTAVAKVRGQLDTLHDDEKVRLPKRHLFALEEAIDQLDGLGEALGDLETTLTHRVYGVIR